MLLFHASMQVIENPNIKYSRDNLDFGKGFYLTDNYSQAKKWCKTIITRYNSIHRTELTTSIINKYEIDLNSLINTYIVKLFDGYSLDWLDFVIKNRDISTDVKQLYDIIIGKMADSGLQCAISDYGKSNGNIDKDLLILESLKLKFENNQICILNQEIIDNYLFYAGYEEVFVNVGRKKKSTGNMLTASNAFKR